MSAVPHWQAAGDYEDIRFELSGDGIARITINRPQKRNAFRPLTVQELCVAFTRVRDNPRIGPPRKIGRVTNVRSWPVPGFEDVRIYYVTLPGIVRVIRVLHGKRDIVSIFDADNPTLN